MKKVVPSVGWAKPAQNQKSVASAGYLYKKTVKEARRRRNLILECKQTPPRVFVTNTRNDKHAAFSLIEMLMALLVASLILAALAPVMTKRMGLNNISISGAGGTLNPPAGSYCWSTTAGGGSTAMEYDEDGNRVVKYTTEQGVYYVNFILASGGGGGGGASEPKTEPAEIISTNKTELKIEANMDEFDVTSVIGGGGGGGGGASVDESTTCTGSVSAEKCACMGYSYDSKNNLCVSSNLGSKNLTNAKTACQNMASGSKWKLPTTGQLSNWGTIYGTFGVTAGQTVWSQTSNQGACSANESYNCWYNGTERTGYSSEDACCSGSSWGKIGTAYKYCSKTTAPSYWYNTYGADLANPCSSNNCTKRTERCSSSSVYCVCAGGSGGSATLTARNYCNQGLMGYCHTGNTCKACNELCAERCGTSTGDTCKSTISRSCSAYYTNYYYYILSGSSWSQSFDTSTSASRSTYCVYNSSDTEGAEAFYSLSGGGGGGAPSIENNSFDSNILNTFRQRIKENTGGYILLEPGEGGEGGSASTGKNQKPANAKNGGATCIAITGENKADIKYRLCAPGGKFGYSADATKTNASSTGWGASGAETPIANACYAIDYVTNPLGETTTFDCTKKGNAGTPGGAGTQNPTPGGKGGASVINNVMAGGTAVVNGVSASSANYGAGGGGGSASKTGLGASGTLSFGKGGNGAGGYIKLNYKIKYDAAGGGGGGAGNLAVVKEYRVNQAECSFVIGKGGGGGSMASNGFNGGNTKVTCTGSGGEIFEVYGGEGGKTGTTATTLGGTSTGGEGGKHDTGGADSKSAYSADIISLPPSKRVLKAGLDGTNGGGNDITYTNYVQALYSAGGRGGTSGVGKKGGCGALLNDSVCTYNNDIIPDTNAILGESLPVNGVKFADLEVVDNYGESSSGGGGGGWHTKTGAGKGGDGLGGYACIWWEKLE